MERGGLRWRACTSTRQLNFVMSMVNLVYTAWSGMMECCDDLDAPEPSPDPADNWLCTTEPSRFLDGELLRDRADGPEGWEWVLPPAAAAGGLARLFAPKLATLSPADRDPAGPCPIPIPTPT